MRSVREYEGVDARGVIGENFAAKIKIDRHPAEVLVFHSLLHIIMLSLGIAIEKLPSFYIPYLRTETGFFSKSVLRKDAVKDCFDELMGYVNLKFKLS